MYETIISQRSGCPFFHLLCIDKQWLLIACRNVIQFLHTTQSHDDCAKS